MYLHQSDIHMSNINDVKKKKLCNFFIEIVEEVLPNPIYTIRKIEIMMF